MNNAHMIRIRQRDAPGRLQFIHTAYSAAAQQLGHPPRQLGDIKSMLGRGWMWQGKHGENTDEQALTEEQRTEILTSPRDRQPFTIAWNEDVRNVGPNLPPVRPLAWETTADSRVGRFVVTTQGKTLYMEADEFRKLQGAQGK